MSGGGTKPFLRCDGATAAFGSLLAVDHIDLSVGQGEVVGIGGPNGAGKTTLIDLISGLVPLSAGRIFCNEQAIGGLPPHRIAQMGVVRTFQLNVGFDSMSVLENVLTASVFGKAKRSGGLFWSSREEERARGLLDRFGLADKAAEMVGNVTILDRKKLMVASALAADPKLLMLDEPVGGLTPQETDNFIELVMGLKQEGITILFIEHVMRFLTTVASRAVIMHHGAIIYDGAPAALAHDEAVTEVYLGSAAKEMRAANGVDGQSAS